MSAIDPPSLGIGFLLGFASGALGKMVADWFREWRNRLKTPVSLTITTTLKTPKKTQMSVFFGFSVKQGEDQVKGAYPKCNGRRYKWCVNDQLPDKVDLLVGEVPTWFSPFVITFEYIADISAEKNDELIQKRKKQSTQGISLIVQERNTSNIVFSQTYSVPIGKTSLNHSTKKKLFPIGITLIAEEGIKREKNYFGELVLKRFWVEKIEKGIPLMDTLDCYFELGVVGNWGV